MRFRARFELSIMLEIFSNFDDAWQDLISVSISQSLSANISKCNLIA